MTETLVLTVIGDDRPGLVETLSKVVLEQGGNWEQSRMLRLAGKFAGILLVSVPKAKARELVRDLGELAGAGLRVQAESSSEPPTPGDARVLELELVGHDRPGIVREIAQALAHRLVSIEELTSGCTSAPMSGEPLFSARARLLVPTTVSVEELKNTLEALANDLMVDLSLVQAQDPLRGAVAGARLPGL